MKIPIYACLFLLAPLSLAQSSITIEPLTYFPLQGPAPLSIQQAAVSSMPFTVAGPRGALLGQQDGTFEAWVYPWKVLSGMRITAEMRDYAVPIDVNEHASSIDVQPDHTTITFSHANFTIREVLFAPQHAPEGAGALAFYQIEAVRPMTVTFRFTPEMKRMWPALADDRPSAEWVKTGESGFYILHTNSEGQAAAIALPQSRSGILPPYQERPKNYPLEFVLDYDPARDRDKVFPLLMTTSEPGGANGSNSALTHRLLILNAAFEKMYRESQEYYEAFLNEHLTIETPDAKLDQAFKWAEVSIDQLRVETTPSHAESALVAGLYSSGDSSRPGFGWYFGRDALWSLYAVNSYGDYKVSRDEFEFLLARQARDGKMPHEWSQTADLVDWKSRPYAYASADSTSLLLMAASDYLNVSGDKAFIDKHWEAIERAWKFETSHDSDSDGIYENTEGTGWVESWIPKMPHQEIYLAALDQQASTAMSRLALATGHAELATSAAARAKHIELQIEKEYLLPGATFYGFSRNADGSVDTSPTIYPAVASWDGTYELHRAQPMLSRWASSEFSTDWGTRDLSPTVSFYDPISYHQGTVWPLFTGWTSLAEYRNGRSLSGYAHLMQNADLTWAHDPGAVTELLSGTYFAPLGRSTSHQLWSSAMVISPVLRGLFGLEWNALGNTLSVTPSLPAEWEHATLKRIPLGDSRLDLTMKREGTMLVVRPSDAAAQSVRLTSHAAGALFANGTLRIPLPAVEAGIPHGLPQPGSTTQQMKILDQQSTPNSLTLKLAAPGGSHQPLLLRINDQKIRDRKVQLKMDGVETRPDGNTALMHLDVSFAPGVGYVEKAVTIRW